ncbi:MAG TPA: hypothetical protein VIF82_02405 [Burkholderiaceae bacterium]
MRLIKTLTVLMFTVFMSMHIEANAANDVVLVEPGPISLPSTKSYSMDEIKKAIIAGALRHQWRVESEAPGTVRIVLDGRRDRAVLVMDVVYDDKSYSVKYVRSEGLRYVKGDAAAFVHNPNSNTVSRVNGGQQTTTIHSSYARWMKALTESINTELTVAKMR